MCHSSVSALMQLIDASPTAFHAVAWARNQLEAMGFRPMQGSTPVQSARRVYATLNNSSLLVLQIAKDPSARSGPVRMGVAHTDSPAIKLKPAFERVAGGLRIANTEIYGGAILRSWLDRDLGLAGRLVLSDGDAGLRELLYRSPHPLAMISSLAPHLSKSDDGDPNPQTQALALLGTEESHSLEHVLHEHVEAYLPGAEILGADLRFHEYAQCCVTGTDRQLISAPRLDNLASCSLLLQSVANWDPDINAALLLCDHEEIGSRTHVGGLGDVIPRILRSTWGDRNGLLPIGSTLLSLDNAHAVHPGYEERHDSEHRCILGKGPVVKTHPGWKYASDDISQALARILWRETNTQRQLIHLQWYTGRADMRSGSTLGPLLASRLGVRAMDIGLPTLGMHAARELAHVQDIEALAALCDTFFGIRQQTLIQASPFANNTGGH